MNSEHQPLPAAGVAAASESNAVRGWYLRLSVAAVLALLPIIGARVYILRAAGNGVALGVLLKTLARGALGSSYDVGLLAALVSVFLIPLLAFRNKRAAARTVYYLFLFFATCLVTAAIAHAQLMNVLHRPFNYQWLQYSDFLHSADSHEAIKASITSRLVLVFLTTIPLYVVISILSGNWLVRNQQKLLASEGQIACVLVAGFIVWFSVGHRYANSHKWPYERLANPIYAFAASWLSSARQPSLFTMKTPIGDSEFEPPAPAMAPPWIAAKSRIEHVIVFVLESTPAEYLGAYGSLYRVTPNLDRWSQHAAVFENVYAHAPATNKSLFSLLCSLYPWISYKSETEEFQLKLPTLASYLRQHGYSTGFFGSSDLSFQRAGDFIRANGFDFVQDYKQRELSRKIFRDERWPFLNGSDDVSTAESLMSWFDQQGGAKPVFAMLWTSMTHYPYFTDDVIKSFGPDENRFNLYLNALHDSDRAFGKVMEWLEKRRLIEKTLVVVLGDHGEAFGRHGQLTHANNVYEENCHVPLLLINPALFTGQREPTVAGLIDLAPTITQILGYPPVKSWQGQSLFSSKRRVRTYFFSPWSDYVFGLRDGSMTFIYNASKNTYEMYDLSADPKETANLIANGGPRSREELLRLAAWVQYQDRLFKHLTDPGKSSPSRAVVAIGSR